MSILTKDRESANLDIASKTISGREYPLNILTKADGTEIDAATEATAVALNIIAAAIQAAVEAINTKATAINTGAIAGTVAVSNLPATQPVSGTVAVSNFPATQPVSGPLTDAQLRATPVPISTAASYAEDSPHTSGDIGNLMLAIRSDSDSPTAGDGDYTILALDAEGRLKVSSKPASYADITGDITAIQATIGTPVAGGTVAGDVSRASNIMAFCTGTFSTVNCTFEGSLEATGDTNWFAVQALRSNANTIELLTGNLSAQPAYGWELSVNALRRVRVRCTARTSGTQSWRFVQGTYATEPIPAAQISGTQPISGSITATLAASTVRGEFVAGAGIWYDDSATVLAGAATFTGTSRDLTVTATATAIANAAAYTQELRVSAESDQSGTLWLEVSRDNTNWRRAKSVATAAITGGGQYAEIVHRPSWRYARVGFTNGATLQTRFSIGSLLMAV